MKPFSEACERNKEPINKIFSKHLPANKSLNVFEMGSGTGQHAAFFSQQFINWQWQPSDLINNHPGIIEWTSELANVAKPLHYEIGQTSLPNFNADVIYTANTFHIVSKELVEKFILEIGQWVQPDTWLIIYGPFNYEGRFTSESNEKFNKFLIETYPGGGIKHFEDILKMLTQQNFKLIEDADMPANNRCLVLRKSSQ